MPFVAQRSIETLKQQINLVDIVAPYVQLKRAGKSWKGLSPFTQEKSPSFYVHPDRGFYKCFSSGEGGDLFTFIMRVENLEFGEAIEFIAKKFNVTLEYEKGGPSREETSLRKQIFELNEIAVEWFHQQFMSAEEAAPVRAYWQEQRGFTLDHAREFKIGYAPAKVDALAMYCKERSFNPAAMEKAGLFFCRENERMYERFKSRFRGRLMIPIRDVQGRAVAFTARQLEQTPQDDPARDAKYVNSPETQIFHKGRILFGMDHARTHLKDGESFLLVEGQLDAIRCWTVGLHTAVAPQGTAITDDQLHLMRRYEPAYVECLLDGDKAGRKAALRALPLTFKAGLEFRFLLLPEKADPDDLLRNGGAEALQELRSQTLSATELAVSEHLPDDRRPTTNEKTSALNAVFELIRHVTSEVAREDYIRIASRLIGVDPIAALKDFNNTARPNILSKDENTESNEPKTNKDPLLTQATWELLWLVLHFSHYAASISETIDYDWINISSPAGRFLQRILAEFKEGLIEDATNIENLIENVEERQLLAEIHTRELKVDDAKAEIINCLTTLRRNHLNRRKKILEQKAQNPDTNPDTQLKLMREVSLIRKSLAQPVTISL